MCPGRATEVTESQALLGRRLGFPALSQAQACRDSPPCLRQEPHSWRPRGGDAASVPTAGGVPGSRAGAGGAERPAVSGTRGRRHTWRVARALSQADLAPPVAPKPCRGCVPPGAPHLRAASAWAPSPDRHAGRGAAWEVLSTLLATPRLQTPRPAAAEGPLQGLAESSGVTRTARAPRGSQSRGLLFRF